ncbi:hypothetical protein [Rothia nasimurium]|uniref:hypothetical protein n=1 Tax=Rothia nasimurium TaxID=85336 RepID=UPI001F3BD51E|nr:hypothetical protein [Rothia nasimurium]
MKPKQEFQNLTDNYFSQIDFEKQKKSLYSADKLPENQIEWLNDYLIKNNLLTTYQKYSFTYNARKTNDPTFWTPHHTIMLIALDDLPIRFYNEVVALGISNLHKILSTNEDHNNLRMCMEKSIIDISRCWDYIFQILNHFYFLHDEILSSKEDVDTTLRFLLSYRPGSQKEELFRMATGEEMREAQESLKEKKKELKHSSLTRRADYFFSIFKKRYLDSPSLYNVRSNLNDPSTRNILTTRNQIMHQHSLFASTQPTHILGAWNQGISHPKTNPSVYKKNLKDIYLASEKLKNSLAICRKIILTSDIPNFQGSEGKKFLAFNVECDRCFTQYTFPKKSESNENYAFCPKCFNKKSIENLKSVSIPEIFFSDLLFTYCEMFSAS